MKPLFVILILIITTTACRSQSPIVSLDVFRQNAPDGAYFKDLNNEFDKFEGIWIATDGNRAFQIQLVKKIMAFNGTDYEDKLIGEYKYMENGNTIVNTLPNITNSNNAKHKIKGSRIIPTDVYLACDDCLPNERRVKLIFYDSERLYLSASIILRYLSDGDPFGQGAQMTATIISDGGGLIPEEDSPTSLRVPYGEYLMTKE